MKKILSIVLIAVIGTAVFAAGKKEKKLLLQQAGLLHSLILQV